MCVENYGSVGVQKRVCEQMKKPICLSRPASDARLPTNTSFATCELVT